MMNTEVPRGQGRKGLAPGIALIFIGILTIPTSLGFVVWKALSAAAQGTQFRAPGSTTITVNEPGSFVAFHETQGTFEGRVHCTSESAIVGIGIEVTFVPDQSDVPVQRHLGTSVELPSVQRQSIARFRAERAGDYLVSASGNTQPAVLFVSKSSLAGMLGLIIGSSAVNLLGMAMIGLGVAWLVRAGLRRGSFKMLLKPCMGRV